MKSCISILLIIFLLEACGRETSTQSNLNSVISPSIGYRLGRGFDPSQPLNLKGDCLANVDEVVELNFKEASGIKGSFSETHIKSMQDLFREVSISGNIAAESMWGSGSASYSKYEKFRSNENSFTWMVSYTVDVGEKTLLGNKLKLSERAEQLVKAGNLDAFYQMCGTEYIRSIKLGGKFIAVYEIESKYSETVKNIQASAEANFGVGSWGFSGSTQFSSYLKDAKFKSILKKEVSQFGGSRIDIDSINPENLGNYLNSLQNEMNKDKAVVLKVETASWDTLGVNGLNEFAKWNRKTVLGKLYEHYRFNINLLNKISDYAYWKNQNIYEISSTQLNDLNKSKIKIDKQQNKISEKASKCIEQNICDAEDLDYVAIIFPTLKEKLITEFLGALKYKIPSKYADYGSLTNYENRLGILYSIPKSIHSDYNIESLNIFVFEKSCQNKDSYIEHIKSNLNQRNIYPKLRDKKYLLNSTDLQWSEGPVRNRQIVFEKNNSNGKCSAIRMTLSSNRDFEWKLSDFNRVISGILETATY